MLFVMKRNSVLNEKHVVKVIGLNQSIIKLSLVNQVSHFIQWIFRIFPKLSEAVVPSTSLLHMICKCQRLDLYYRLRRH